MVVSNGIVSPQSADPAAGCQLNNIFFSYLSAVENSGKSPPMSSRLYFLFGTLLWNSNACIDRKFPFVDGFHSKVSPLASCTTEEERWNALSARFILSLYALQKSETPLDRKSVV